MTATPEAADAPTTPPTPVTTPVSASAVRVDGTTAAAVPAPAEGVQLLGEMEGSGYRRPPALVRRSDGQTITLTPLLYLTLKAIDGRRGYDGIAAALTAATQRRVTADDVAYLAERKLRPLGLLRGADGTEPQTSKANPLLALRLKVVVSNPALTRRITAPFAWLFHPVVAVPLLVAFAAVTWWVLFDKGLASATHQAFYQPGMILALWSMIVLSAGFHEFGHAAACRYGGATPGVMGAGLYLVWPAFYTEVTDSYRLGRGGRLRVDLGGLYFNAIFALAIVGAWAVLRWDALLLVAVAQHLQMVRQLAPFIRADGYHIVADLTGVPDLFAHIKPTLLNLVPRRWRPEGAPRPALKRWARMVVVGWVALVVPVLLGLLALAVLLLPRLAATAWDSMGTQWAAAETYWLEGDLLGVFVRLFSAAVVALPVLGILYLLTRLARAGAVSAWTATRGNRRGRAGLLLLAAGAAAGLVWAWWPADQYRPIDKNADGTLPALVTQEVEDRRMFLPLLYRAAPLVSDELPELQLPVWLQSTAAPSGYLNPTASATPVTAYPAVSGQPATAPATTSPGTAVEVDGPAGAPDPPVDTPAHEWPFPFDRPVEPAPGDNRAQAVNTTDGSVQADLAVAWAIVTANEVTQRNEAYALASCRDCATMAVAFQVLLIVGDAQVITPVNAAVAVNYQCHTCLTEAIAVQLILSLTDMPSQEAQLQVAALMDKVAALEVDLTTLSGGQVYYLLRATEAEILRVLAEDGVLPQLPSTGATTTGEPIGGTATEPTAPDTTGTSEGDPATGDTATPPPSTESGTTSTEPTPEPSTEPTAQPGTGAAEPTAEPAAEPAAEPTAEPTPTGTEPSSQPSATSPSAP